MKVREVCIEATGGPLSLSVAEAGVGGRPLVLVHGFTGAKEDFTDWLDALAALGWHVIAPDQRGHGASPKPDDELAYSFDLFAQDLLALLDAMAWERVVALGHSMGGMVLQTAALGAQQRFAAMVLMDTSHRGLRADPTVVELAVSVARTRGMAAVLATQDALDDEQTLGNDIDRRVKAERPGYKEFGERKMLASSPAMYASMIQAITSPAARDRLEDLSTLTMPTLVIVGEHDQPFVQPSYRMAKAIPDAVLAVIPGAAHSPQFEAPDPWWDALCGFLGRL
ncbi:MAG: alpha/beta fold hydrolase [Microthrixaceae bacterium]